MMRGRIWVRSAFLIGGVAAATLLSGCAPTAQGILKKEQLAYEKTDGVGDLSLALTMDAALYANLGGTAQSGSSMKLTVDMDMDLSSEPYSASGKMTTTLSLAGSEYREGSELYLVPEDDGYATYTSSSGNWYRTVSEAGSADVLANGDFQAELAELGQDALTLSKERVQVREQDCWRIDAVLTGEMLETLVDSSMINGSGIGLDADSIDWSDSTATYTIYINAKTYLPVRVEVDMSGMEGMFNSLFAAGNVDGSMEIREYRVVMDYESFEPHDPISVPEDIKREAQILARLMEGQVDNGDGTYTIYETGASGKVSAYLIQPPVGMTVESTGYDLVQMTNAEGTESAAYRAFTLSEGTLPEDMGYQASVDANAFALDVAEATGYLYEAYVSEENYGETTNALGTWGTYWGDISMVGNSMANFRAAWISLDEAGECCLMVEVITTDGAHLTDEEFAEKYLPGLLGSALDGAAGPAAA